MLDFLKRTFKESLDFINPLRILMSKIISIQLYVLKYTMYISVFTLIYKLFMEYRGLYRIEWITFYLVSLILLKMGIESIDKSIEKRKNIKS